MTLSALVGIVGTGTASASTGTRECIDNSTGRYCAVTGLGQWNLEMSFQSPGSLAYSLWNSPNTIYPNAGSTGTIRENGGTGMCMQIDHASSPPNMVRMATCNGDDAEKWTDYYNTATRRTEYQSYWAYHDDGATSLCLSFDIADGDVIRADPCLPGGGTSYWYQQWGTS
jgi:ricin-type beta-trefoil lectin protein